MKAEMDVNQKQKALKQLAKMEGKSADDALNKEADKITAILKKDSQYDHIANQLEFLDIISHRISEKSVNIIKVFLKRLASLELTYGPISGITESKLKEFQNKASLTIEALNILGNIRYHQIEAILSLFLDYSIDENEKIRKKALSGLEILSDYNIDVFYGQGDWKGLGVGPQYIILEKLESLTKPQRLQYFEGATTLCKNLLSPTLRGTSSDYKTITLTSGAVPALDQVKDIRNKTLTFLEELFHQELTIKQKLSVKSAIHSAARPHHGHHDDNVTKMIQENTLRVFTFFESIIPNVELQIVEEIEHDSYWIYYHSRKNENIESLAMKIKDKLDNFDEYQIYKTLVGFQGIFQEWSLTKEDQKEFKNRYQEINEWRNQKGKEYAELISEDNFSEWENRIVEYASTESNDLMTFPHFGKFLEHFCISSPTLGLRLLSNQIKTLDRFLLPILSGLWKGDQETIRTIISGWVAEGKYLQDIARIFEYGEDIDVELLKTILNKSVEIQDNSALIQILFSVASKYDSRKIQLKDELFIPSLKALSDLKDARWIFNFWYISRKNNIFDELTKDDCEIVLENMLNLNSIDYNSEEILTSISKRYPEEVLKFFEKRLQKEADGKLASSFDAIPYDFHELNKELSKQPRLVVHIVREWYDGNYGMFTYQGARLLKNIFPDFPELFQKQLIELIQTNEESNIKFVMAILRNYEGQIFLHAVCKELINALPEEGKLLSEVTIILQSTGVVEGAYGFAEAYEKKIKETEGWLSDPNEKVCKFAKNYIALLEERIKSERLRVDEEIELRKHQFGVNED